MENSHEHEHRTLTSQEMSLFKSSEMKHILGKVLYFSAFTINWEENAVTTCRTGCHNSEAIDSSKICRKTYNNSD